MTALRSRQWSNKSGGDWLGAQVSCDSPPYCRGAGGDEFPRKATMFWKRSWANPMVGYISTLKVAMSRLPFVPCRVSNSAGTLTIVSACSPVAAYRPGKSPGSGNSDAGEAVISAFAGLGVDAVTEVNAAEFLPI